MGGREDAPGDFHRLRQQPPQRADAAEEEPVAEERDQQPPAVPRQRARDRAGAHRQPAPPGGRLPTQHGRAEADVGGARQGHRVPPRTTRAVRDRTAGVCCVELFCGERKDGEDKDGVVLGLFFVLRWFSPNRPNLG